MWLTGFGRHRLPILTIVCLHQKNAAGFYSPFKAIRKNDSVKAEQGIFL
jgi:hypothetical protein